jgi:hypothetical protein
LCPDEDDDDDDDDEDAQHCRPTFSLKNVGSQSMRQYLAIFTKA